MQRIRAGLIAFVALGLLLSAQRVCAQVELLPPVEAEAIPAEKAYTFEDFFRICIANNPRLRSAAYAIDAAQGRAVQAGLYPNPTLMVGGEEVGGGEGGIHTWPAVSQQIVTAGKRRLSKAIAERSVDMASLQLAAQRMQTFSLVRQGYVQLLALQQRLQVVTDLRQAIDKLYDKAKQREKLLGTELNSLTFRMELNRLDLELKSISFRYQAAWRKLAATVGMPQLAPAPVAGHLQHGVPRYEYETLREFVATAHPRILAARVAVQRAELTLTRARRGAIPNVTLGGGYQRNFNDNAHQGTYQINVPIPLFNRNQGNVLTAKANVGRAVENERQTTYQLLSQLATVYGRYGVALQQLEFATHRIVPTAERIVHLSQKAFEGAQQDLAAVLLAQKALGEVKTAQLDALQAAWQAAAELTAFLADEACFAPGP